MLGTLDSLFRVYGFRFQTKVPLAKNYFYHDLIWVREEVVCLEEFLAIKDTDACWEFNPNINNCTLYSKRQKTRWLTFKSWKSQTNWNCIHNCLASFFRTSAIEWYFVPRYRESKSNKTIKSINVARQE